MSKIKINHVIILVGGKGKRLGEITKKTPKPLIKFNNVEFLDYQINLLTKLKPKKIILLSGYKKKKFKEKYHNKNFNGVKMICKFENKKLLGTGGSLEQAKSYIVNNTLLCNGDTYFDYNFQNLNKIKFNSIFLLLVKNKIYKSNNKLTNLSIINNIVIFKKRSLFMNSGFYIISKKFKKFLKKGVFSLEKDIIEELIKKEKVTGKIIKGKHIDIGTKKNLEYFKKYSKKNLINKITIN